MKKILCYETEVNVVPEEIVSIDNLSLKKDKFVGRCPTNFLVCGAETANIQLRDSKDEFRLC